MEAVWLLLLFLLLLVSLKVQVEVLAGDVTNVLDVLDDALDVVNGVALLDLQRERLASGGLDEDLYQAVILKAGLTTNTQ